MEEVILVDELDKVVGLMEKMEAHEKGLLHRAFSIFVLNSNNELLLQKRASHKYHSGGLWTNTCCSHQRKNETNLEAGRRRLHEEMGMECELHEMFSFIYKAELDQDLTEHELDHVMIGRSDTMPVINADEVEEWKYMPLEDITLDMQENGHHYTEWFKIIFQRFMNESNKY